jgi:histidinol-phosphate aminotransferase
MNKFWSNRIKNTLPYVPGEQPKGKEYIKLNTNENPYPPSAKIKKTFESFEYDLLRLYPDPNCDDLKGAISEFYEINKEMVFVGNGSDEILGFSFLAFTNEGTKVYFPKITYSFYEVYSRFFRVSHEAVQMIDDLYIDVEKFMDVKGVVLLANPNAPTGILLDLAEIENILRANNESLVIIDEAYIDFGGNSSVCLLDKYSNLLIIKTFSKSRSLAGVRVGYALGNKNLICALENAKNSFNSYTLDRFALLAAKEAILDKNYFEETISKIIKTREWVTKKLREMGFEIPESKANFIFISYPNIGGATIYKRLKEMGILVRYFNKDILNKYLRVTMGNDEEMKFFINSIERIIGEIGKGESS